MVKKVIFAFILINLLGVLKVNALTIAVFDTNYDVVGYCNNCNEVYPTDAPYAYANRVVITYDNIAITNQLNYDVDLSFNIYTSNNIQFSNKTLYIFGNEHYPQNATQNLRITNVSDIPFIEIGTGKNSQVSYNASFTSTQNGNVRLDLEFNRQLWSYLKINNALITYKGQNNNDSINTSTQNIINNNNSNTNQIIQNDKQNTQDIIDNQNDNAQDIIDNQNQNTQQEIESQKVCIKKIIDDKYVIESSKTLNSSGDAINSSSSNGVTDFLDITNVTNIKNLSTTGANTNYYFCTYDINKTKINCYNRASYVDQTISISSNEKFVRFTINLQINRPQFEFTECKNGNQALNDSLNGLNDTLNDTSQPNTNQDINDMNNMVASDTPISDLITMPLTLINAYINGVNSSCSPVNLGNLYGTDLVLPCINLEQRVGSNLWHIIDAFFSIFMCYNIGMLFVSAFDGITSLRDDFEGLYQPRHADTGYQPKHGG